MQVTINENGSRARIDTHDAQKDAYISDVFVPKGLRGKGLGTQIVQKCLTICKALGVNTVIIHVSTNNPAMVRIIQKLNFTQIDIEVCYENTTE